MKPRRVIVEIEIETVASVKDLKAEFKAPFYIKGEFIMPIQVSANVIRVPEPKKTAKRR